MSLHSDRRLATLVVTGKVGELAIAEAYVERLRTSVGCANFQADLGDAGDQRTLLEPRVQSASYAHAPIQMCDAEELEARFLALVETRSPA